MPAVSTTNFPKKGANRTRSEAISEIADYTGGANRPDVQRRAGRAWDTAVRKFNNKQWKFNRMSQDITLATTTASETYSLNSDFHLPLRGVLLDSNGKKRGSIGLVDYEELLTFGRSNVNTSPAPTVYSFRNIHQEGFVYFRPIPSTSPQYPTVQLHYFRLIALATGDQERLNVPQDVDQAIFEEAVAEHVMRSKSAAEARGFKELAFVSLTDVERTWRDYEDITNLRSLEYV